MLTVALVVMIGLNLRPSMAVIGPLFHQIQGDIALSFTHIAWLTSLPVFTMGAGCFLAMRMARHVGMSRLMLMSMVLIAMAGGGRAFSPSFERLLLTALLAGIGIAFIQALLPALIKTHCASQAALVMGCYVAAIMGGAALSSSTASGLASLLGHWQYALASWGLFAGLTAVVWVFRGAVLPPAPPENQQRVYPTPLWSQARVWHLALFFGLGTAGYTCVLAWLPPYFITLGWSETGAGTLLGYVTAMEVISGLALPFLARHSRDRRPVVMLALTFALLGFILLWLAPLRVPYLATALLGAGIGGLFPMSLIMAMDHHDDPQRAGAIVGIVQGVGYFIAALSPLAAGTLRDALGSFSSAWAALAVIMIIMAGMCVRFDPRRYAEVIRN